MARRCARGAEDGDGALDLREGVKPHRELLCDVAYALGVGGPHLGRLVAEPQQQLLVERGRLLTFVLLIAAHARKVMRSVQVGSRQPDRCVP